MTAPNRRGYRFQQPEAKEGAYEIAAAAEIKVPCIILVNPFLDQNVGSVSRAMLNFGLHELRVVDPRCDILSDQARALAVGSVAILENAKIFPTVAEAVADLQRIFATTVRPRRKYHQAINPSLLSVESSGSYLTPFLLPSTFIRHDTSHSNPFSCCRSGCFFYLQYGQIWYSVWT